MRLKIGCKLLISIILLLSWSWGFFRTVFLEFDYNLPGFVCWLTTSTRLMLCSRTDCKSNAANTLHCSGRVKMLPVDWELGTYIGSTISQWFSGNPGSNNRPPYVLQSQIELKTGIVASLQCILQLTARTHFRRQYFSLLPIKCHDFYHIIVIKEPGRESVIKT